MAVPNKHIPICSPGPRPARGLETPPDSPPRKAAATDTVSLLYPPTKYSKVIDSPHFYFIDAADLSDALEHLSTQPLPDPRLVFPWLHGLHAENQIQLAFFVARRRSLRKAPKCVRGITIVKAGTDLATSKLRGAILPDELLDGLAGSEPDSAFFECDPKTGFSVRNFHIQACKLAALSDIVVYGDDNTSQEELIGLARRFSIAQRASRKKHEPSSGQVQEFNTFVLTGTHFFCLVSSNRVPRTDTSIQILSRGLKAIILSSWR